MTQMQAYGLDMNDSKQISECGFLFKLLNLRG